MVFNGNEFIVFLLTTNNLAAHHTELNQNMPYEIANDAIMFTDHYQTRSVLTVVSEPPNNEWLYGAKNQKFNVLTFFCEGCKYKNKGTFIICQTEQTREIKNVLKYCYHVPCWHWTSLGISAQTLVTQLQSKGVVKKPA